MIDLVINGWRLMAKAPIMFVPFVFVLGWCADRASRGLPLPKLAVPTIAAWTLGSAIGIPMLYPFLLMLVMTIALGSGSQLAVTVSAIVFLAVGVTWHFGIIALLLHWSRKVK